MANRGRTGRDVVITGLGAVSPAGIGVPVLWDRVRGGNSVGSRITRFDASRGSSQVAAEVPAFGAPRLGLAPDEVARMDRVTQFARVAASEATQDSHLGDGQFDPRRAGVVLGTAIGGVEFMERVFRSVCCNSNGKPKWVTVRPEKVDPNLYTGFLAQSLSSEVALALGFRGFTTTIATGCTAGLDAIGAAATA